MSDVVSTSTDTLCRVQDRPGSVPVAICLESAGLAPEGSFRQVEACLSLAAPRTRHCRAGGRHQHRRPACPRATFDRRTFSCPDRSVSVLGAHHGRGHEPGFGARHRDHLMVVDHVLGPDTSNMGVVQLGFLVRLRGFRLGPPVAVRVRRAFVVSAAHPRLSLYELGGTPLPVAEVGQVEGGVGGGGSGRSSPVDADGPEDLGCGPDLVAEHERRIALTDAVLVDADARRVPIHGTPALGAADQQLFRGRCGSTSEVVKQYADNQRTA